MAGQKIEWNIASKPTITGVYYVTDYDVATALHHLIRKDPVISDNATGGTNLISQTVDYDDIHENQYITCLTST